MGQVELRATRVLGVERELCGDGTDHDGSIELANELGGVCAGDGARSEELASVGSVCSGKHLVSPGIEQREARLRPRLGHGSGHRLERRDADDRDVEAQGDSLGERDAHAQADERAGPGADRHALDARARPPGAVEQVCDEREHALGVGIQLVVLGSREDPAFLEEGRRTAAGRCLQSQNPHRGGMYDDGGAPGQTRREYA